VGIACCVGDYFFSQQENVTDMIINIWRVKRIVHLCAEKREEPTAELDKKKI